jgi:phage/plasmid-like protein (TIGR03299 family)
MAHEIHKDANGKHSFAFVGEDTWHGLGQQLTPNSPIPVWVEEAGFNFEINDAIVQAKAQNSGNIITFPEKKLLYRSDTLAPLSVVGSKYKVVQPGEVLEFFEDLVEAGGFQLETAGVLFGGKRFFALAKVAEEQAVMKGDHVKGYLLLSTSCDGSLATTAQFTSVRVVCNNTLSYALKSHDGSEQSRFKIPHSATFDPSVVKDQLGLSQNSFNMFMEDMRLLASKPLSKKDEIDFLIDLFGNPQVSLEDQEGGPAKLMKQVHALYAGTGMGSTAAGRTAWGMLNAVTEYTDHHTGHKTDDARIDSAWFGTNATLKTRAKDLLLLTTAG